MHLSQRSSRVNTYRLASGLAGLGFDGGQPLDGFSIQAHEPLSIALRKSRASIDALSNPCRIKRAVWIAVRHRIDWGESEQTNEAGHYFAAFGLRFAGFFCPASYFLICRSNSATRPSSFAFSGSTQSG